MKELFCDIAVIGAGAAGLSAAHAAASCGASTAVIDREEAPGGVLLQCIHNGFGLHYFREELTGPEYAERMALQVRKAQVKMLSGHTAISVTPCGEGHELILYSGKTGVTRLHAGAVILATGCRERTRANIAVPGDRPAGVFTAGLAQKLVNMEGVAPGKRAVIVGSGDIGLIMARRLTWSGIEVARVVEIQPYPSGLARNIAQCLDDFGIRLDLATRITGIYGRDRVESVTLSPLSDPGKTEKIHCDTVLFSVGLIPENELARKCGVRLHPVTGGAVTDSAHMTSVPGIFACGNALHVHDLADYASAEGALCGKSAVDFLRGERAPADIPVEAGLHLRYTAPCGCRPGVPNRFYMRPAKVLNNAVFRAVQGNTVLKTQRLQAARPAEMLTMEITVNDPAAGVIRFELEGEEA